MDTSNEIAIEGETTSAIDGQSSPEATAVSDPPVVETPEASTSSLNEAPPQAVTEPIAEAQSTPETAVEAVASVSETASDVPQPDAPAETIVDAPVSESVNVAEHPLTETPAPLAEVASTPSASPLKSGGLSIATEFLSVPSVDKEIEAATKKTATASKKSKAPKASNTSKSTKKNFPDSFKPKDVFARLSQNKTVLKAYLHEVQWLYAAIYREGLGLALSHLASEGQHKRKKQLFFDLNQWVFNEMKLKGKNKRHILESVVYGAPAFQMEATEAVLYYLTQIMEGAQRNQNV